MNHPYCECGWEPPEDPSIASSAFHRSHRDHHRRVIGNNWHLDELVKVAEALDWMDAAHEARRMRKDRVVDTVILFVVFWLLLSGLWPLEVTPGVDGLVRIAAAWALFSRWTLVRRHPEQSRKRRTP
jgi:hypothetical protein